MTKDQMPADGTIDGDGVWRGGKWHPNAPLSSKQRVIDHLDQVVDCLRYRPVATTALQMRQAADEIQRCWREHDEDVDRMERAAIVIERLRAVAVAAKALAQTAESLHGVLNHSQQIVSESKLTALETALAQAGYDMTDEEFERAAAETAGGA